MNGAFFTNCKTLDELQTAYRQLLQQYHPDKHPGEDLKIWTELTQQLNLEYAFTAAKLRSEEARAKAREKGKPEPTAFEYASWAAVDEEIRKRIEEIVFLPDIEIEICGFWVWVSGETKPVKEQLKAAKFQWAPKKEKWYYAGVPSNSRGALSMDQIYERYGRTRVPNQRRTRIGEDD